MNKMIVMMLLISTAITAKAEISADFNASDFNGAYKVQAGDCFGRIGASKSTDEQENVKIEISEDHHLIVSNSKHGMRVLLSAASSTRKYADAEGSSVEEKVSNVSKNKISVMSKLRGLRYWVLPVQMLEAHELNRTDDGTVKLNYLNSYGEFNNDPIQSTCTLVPVREN